MELDRSPREDRQWPRRPRWLVSADRRMAASVERVTENIDAYVEHGNRLPEFRDRVRALAESRRGEPVVAVHLDKGFGLEFDVPGRRADGTVKGERLVRRFFWNILRSVVNALANVLLFSFGAAGNVFSGNGSVTGPENSRALGLVDAVRSAKSPWLVYAANPMGDSRVAYKPSYIAVIDSHSSSAYDDPADVPPPTLLWDVEEPHVPLVLPRRHRLTWPDGSKFTYTISDDKRWMLE